MLAHRRLLHGLLAGVLCLVVVTQAMDRCAAPYPDRCDCDPPAQNKTGTIVYCRHLHLDYIPQQFPADTVIINFGDNSITEVTSSSFRSLPVLHTLILDECGIETISEDAFQHLTALRVLKLTKNKIENLHPGTFHGLVSLEELHLDGNQITNIPDLLFSGLSLADVNLQGNKIHTIADRAFHGAAIKRLQMDNNYVGSISEQALGPLRNSLKTLALSHNRQPLDLESAVFSGFSFEELSLCDNGLMNTSFLKATKATNLDIGANPLYSVDFKDYANLQYTHKFYLRNVSIDNLNEVTLVNLREVSLLDLSRNKLVEVQTSVFRYTPNLDTLILSENVLAEVPRNLGVYLSDLRKLDLSSNRISTLRAADFENLNNLHSLLLTNNQVQVIPQAMQPVFDRISTVRLDNNPLHCNCEMRWFREWLDVYRTSMGVDYCFTPHFQYIFNMEHDDFKCSAPTIRTINTNLTVTRGNSFFLTCTAESDPAPQVEWLAPFGDRISITPSRNRTRLKTSAIWKIDNILPEQAGVYTCSGTNIAGQIQSHVCVLVEQDGVVISDPCVFPTDPPDTTTTEAPTTLVVSTTVVMTTTEDSIATTPGETPGVTNDITSDIEDTKATTTVTVAVTTDSTSAAPIRSTTISQIRSPRPTHIIKPNTQDSNAAPNSGIDNTTVAYIVLGGVLALSILVIIVLVACHVSKKRKEKRDYELANAKAAESQA